MASQVLVEFEEDTSRFLEYPPLLDTVDPGRTVRPEAPLGQFSVYIHIPFCRRLCSFCPYVKYRGDQTEIDRYFDALLTEIEIFDDRVSLLSNRPLAVFVGGGTPTIFGTRRLRTLFERLAAIFTIDADVEVTLESTPRDLISVDLSALAKYGLNRLSVGVQSFDPALLRRIGSPNTNREITDALRMAADARMPFNLDLLYAIPSQTLEHWAADLSSAVAVGPSHISTYRLRHEIGTPLRASRDYEVAPISKFYSRADEVLNRSAFSRYSADHFATADNRCRYGLSTSYNEVIGFGVSAYSFIAGALWRNEDALSNYASLVREGRLPRRFGRRLTPVEVARRTVIKRLLYLDVDYHDLRRFERSPGMPAIRRAASKARAAGWAYDVPNGFRLTAAGAINLYALEKLFYDDAASDIMRAFPFLKRGEMRSLQ